MMSKEMIYERLSGVFMPQQALILTEVVTDHHEDSVNKEDFSELKGIVRELAEAQKRTEVKVEELAEAQKRTEHELTVLSKSVAQLEKTQSEGFKALQDQIAALGSRWGIYNEAVFRSTLKGIFSKQKDIKIENGYYGNREVDIIIRNGEHILLEITSRLKLSDIHRLIASAADYKARHNIEPALMVATSYISPRLMQKILDMPQKIEVFSYEAEEEA